MGWTSWRQVAGYTRCTLETRTERAVHVCDRRLDHRSPSLARAVEAGDVLVERREDLRPEVGVGHVAELLDGHPIAGSTRGLAHLMI